MTRIGDIAWQSLGPLHPLVWSYRASSYYCGSIPLIQFQDPNDGSRSITVDANYHVPVQPASGSITTPPTVSNSARRLAATHPGSLLFQTDSAFFDAEKFVNTATSSEAGNVFRISKGVKDVGKITFDGLEGETGNTLPSRYELIAIFEPYMHPRITHPAQQKLWLETTMIDVMVIRREKGLARRLGIGKVKLQHWRNSHRLFKTIVLI